MSKVEEHVGKLEAFGKILEGCYKEQKHWSTEENIYKKALEKYFHSQKDSVLNIDGMLLQERSRTSYEFDPSFYDFLEDQAKLPLAVGITKKMETEYSVGDFRLPETNCLKVSVPRTTPEKKKQKEAAEEERISLLALEPAEDLVAELRGIKMDLEVAKQQYDSAKEDLLQYLLENELKDEAVQTSIGKFYVSENNPEYNIDALFYAEVEQKLNFLFLYKEEGVVCLDLFSKEEFMVPHDTSFLYKGISLTFEDGTMLANNHALTESNFLVQLKPRKEMPVINGMLNEGWELVSGTIVIDSNTFFRQCPIQSSNLEKLADEGLLKENDIQQYKKPTGDSTDFVEIIEEVSNDERKFLFMSKRMQRSEVLREREG